jgi:hypothetical protein
VSHDVAPETVLKLPAAHVKHVEAPAVVVYVPGGHMAQVELLGDPRRSE